MYLSNCTFNSTSWLLCFRMINKQTKRASDPQSWLYILQTPLAKMNWRQFLILPSRYAQSARWLRLFESAPEWLRQGSGTFGFLATAVKLHLDDETSGAAVCAAHGATLVSLSLSARQILTDERACKCGSLARTSAHWEAIVTVMCLCACVCLCVCVGL